MTPHLIPFMLNLMLPYPNTNSQPPTLRAIPFLNTTTTTTRFSLFFSLWLNLPPHFGFSYLLYYYYSMLLLLLHSNCISTTPTPPHCSPSRTASPTFPALTSSPHGISPLLAPAPPSPASPALSPIPIWTPPPP